MSRELMPKSGILMPHVVISRDAAVVGVSTVDGAAGAIDLSQKYLTIDSARNTYLTKTEGATKEYVGAVISPVMEGALFKDDPYINNNIPIRSGGANGVESVDMIKVTDSNAIKIGSYESAVQGIELHSAGRISVVDKNASGVETKYPIYSQRYRPEISELPFAAIGSYVKDAQGRTIGVNRTGINADITQMTQKVTFTQAPTVPDAAQPYDAVNLRQLQAAGGGGGATMSGVMNNFIGAVEWFNGTRAKLPPGYIVADGQEESQTDPATADLYAAVNANVFTVTTETIWQTDIRWRASYVKQSATAGKFRVPDLNGVSPGATQALFLRGHAGMLNVGTVMANAAPNIQGTFTIATKGSNGFGLSGINLTGPFHSAGGTGSRLTGLDANIVTDSPGELVGFDANKANASYGRDGATEVRPNCAVGIWIIRANGNFQAANTSWNVINGDSTTPPSSTTVYGGDVWSTYQVSGADYVKLGYRAKVTIGGVSTGELRLADSRSGGISKTWELPLGGGTLLSTDDVGNSGNKIPRLNAANVWTSSQYFQDAGLALQTLNQNPSLANTSAPRFTSYVKSGVDDVRLGAVFFANFDGNSLRRAVIQVTTDQDQIAQTFSLDQNGDIMSSKGVAQWGGSDVRIKYDFESPAPGHKERIASIGVSEHKYKGSDIISRGFLAQQMETIDPKYVFSGGEAVDEDGKTFEILNVDTRAVIADLVSTVQDLMKEIEELKDSR